MLTFDAVEQVRSSNVLRFELAHIEFRITQGKDKAEQGILCDGRLRRPESRASFIELHFVFGKGTHAYGELLMLGHPWHPASTHEADG